MQEGAWERLPARGQAEEEKGWEWKNEERPQVLAKLVLNDLHGFPACDSRAAPRIDPVAYFWLQGGVIWMKA